MNEGIATLSITNMGDGIGEIKGGGSNAPYLTDAIDRVGGRFKSK